MSPQHSRILLSSLFAAAAVFHSALCFAAEPSPSPTAEPSPTPTTAKPDKKLVFQAYQIPRSIFETTSDTGNGKQTRSVPPKQYFEELGVPFPPGSEVVYDQSGKFLLIRQTPENLDLIDALVTPTCGGPVTQVEVEIRAFRCSSTTLSKLQSAKQADDAIKALGKSLILLDRMTGTLRSGHDLRFNNLYYSSAIDPQMPRLTAAKAIESGTTSASEENTPFQPGEYGTKSYLQATVGSDEATMEFQLAYRLHIPVSKAAKTAIVDMNARTDFMAYDGCTFVIKAASIPNLLKSDSPEETENVVVVFRANIIDAAGRIVRDVAWKFPPYPTYSAKPDQ